MKKFIATLLFLVSLLYMPAELLGEEHPDSLGTPEISLMFAGSRHLRIMRTHGTPREIAPYGSCG